MKTFKALILLPLYTLHFELVAQQSHFERYEENQAHEQQLIEELARKFQILQENSMHDGKKLRGTHAKGTCAEGSLEVYDVKEPSYRKGLFAEAARYPVRLRFANGASTINPDFEPDARSISVSVDLGDGSKQDFSMNNGPVFPIGSLGQFNFLLDVGFVKAKAYKDALADGMSEKEAASSAKKASLVYLAKHPSWLPAFARMMKLGEELKNQEVLSYRNIKYWSGSAFKYGEHQAAKFALTPCSHDIGGKPDLKDPDYLQKDLINAVSTLREPICFEFQVQLLDEENMRKKGLFRSKKLAAWEWVEDPTLDWDKAGAKFHTVAKLSITPNSIYDQESCDDPENGFNVIKNALPQHRGLGRLNRGRTKSEELSRENR